MFRCKFFPPTRNHIIVFAIMVAVLIASCTGPRVSTFQGLYTTAFEVSVFHPCGVRIPTEIVEDVGFQMYWLESAPDSGFNERLEAFHSLRGPTGELKLFVKFVGTTSPTKPFGYGHLGMWANQVTVTEVLDMRPWVANQCQFE
jgi:hypothetical protein